MEKSEIKDLEKFVSKIIKHKSKDLKQLTNSPSLKEQSKYNKKCGLVEEVRG